MTQAATESAAKEKYYKALQILKPFCKKNIGLANWQAFSTFAGLCVLCIGSYLLYDVHPALSLFTFPFITALLCRCYVIEHDCGHQSFYRSRTANAVVGNIFGFFILVPYEMWRYIHDSHHNNVGNLDKRHLNPELWTLTVEEYKASSPAKRFLYRMMRSKASRLVFAPWVIFVVIFRIPHHRLNASSLISVIVYDAFYFLAIYFLLQIMPVEKLLMIYGIPLYAFLVIAAYVFYAQHQFEDTYWEKQENWSYEEATFLGSTYLSSPKWFNWMSGNAGYHNIHHLISGIPNYNLEKAQHALDGILEFKPISVFRVYSLLGLKVWDEKRKKLIPFSEIES